MQKNLPLPFSQFKNFGYNNNSNLTEVLDIFHFKLDNSLEFYSLVIKIMKSNFISHLIVTLSLLFISISASADQWYHVELIVFQQLDTITDEQWPKMPEQNQDQDKLLIPTMKSQLIQPDKNETLISSATRLNRSSHYKVLYHQSWQQPIMKKRHAEAIKIHSDDDMIDGSLRLYKSTYLHAAINLWLLENKESINSWSDVSPDGENIDNIRNPHLEQSGRIRSKKLYFFDHPKMGVLLKITPIDTPANVQSSEKSLESFSLPTEATPTTASTASE